MNCYICGAEVKGNLEGTIQCGLCTQRKVEYIRRLERETGIDIVNTKVYFMALERRKTKKDKVALATLLKRLRIRDGYSQQFLADLTGVSKSYLQAMESGRKPLTNKVLDYIKESNGKVEA